MPNIRFTHLLNPFTAKPGSEHDIAQRVTFQALRNAAEESTRAGIGVEVLSVVYPQDMASAEAPSRVVAELSRSVQDVHPMSPPRMFPLVKDLLNLAAQHGQGDYIVFTNVDISPQPFLYKVLDELMKTDPERAVIVNRRTIPRVISDPAQISLAYREAGNSHHGHDCFVFPRAWVPQLILNDVCIGAPWWDYALLANLDALSKFRMFTYLHQRLTFHLGDDRAWTALSDYDVYNQRQVLAVIEALEQRHGKAPAESRFAWVAQRARQQPASQRTLAAKIRRKLRAVHELGVLLRARGMAKRSPFYSGTETVAVPRA
jgi:hypothetical protein